MALVKRRPKLTLLAPREVVRGVPFEVELVIDARREVPIDFVDLRVEGVESSVINPGKHGRQFQLTWLSTSSRLIGETVLPAGAHRRTLRLAVPSSASPTYRGNYASTTYVCTAHVSIPWWPDRRKSWLLYATLPPGVRGAPTGTVWATSSTGPRATEAYVEVTLAHEQVVAGDTIEGSIALMNTRHNRYTRAEIALVGYEKRFEPVGIHRHTTEIGRWGVGFPLQSPSDGMAIPFRMGVPSDLMPTYAASLWHVEWMLEVTIQSALARDPKVQIPILVLPRGSVGQGTMRAAPPSIGNERVHRIWTGVAQELGLSFEDEALLGQVDDVAIAIRREHRGARGIHLVAELTHPSVHLDLEVRPAGAVRRLLGGGITLGDDDWDARHHVRARDAAQAQTFAGVLFDMIRKHRIVSWGDDRLVLEVKSAGTTHAPLRELAAAAIAIAHAMSVARAAIPPPRAMADALPAWRDLARRLRGELELSRMAVRGAIDGRPCSVVTEWSGDGEPLRTVLAIDAGAPFDPKHRVVWSPSRASPRLLESLPNAVVELWPALAEGALEARIAESSIEVSLPGTIDTPVPVVTDRLATMSRLVSALRGDGGPYR